MFEKFRAKRQLKKVRADLQILWDEAQRRRAGAVDRYPHTTDLLNSKEERVYNEVKEEEYWLSKFLGQTPQWGDAKSLYRTEPSSPDAYMRVREDHSTKVSYEYVELVDMMVKTVDGKWSSYRHDWETVEGFKRQGWGRPPEFNDYLKRWHEAETPEETEAVLEEYRSRFPNAVY